MMQPHINEKKGAPWWAAIGAPLIGVPIMVALLTLASPSENGPEVGSRSELVEPQVVRPAVLEAEYFEEHRRS